VAPRNDQDSRLLYALERRLDPHGADQVGKVDCVARHAGLDARHDDMRQKQERDEQAQSELRTFSTAHAQRLAPVQCSQRKAEMCEQRAGKQRRAGRRSPGCHQPGCGGVHDACRDETEPDIAEVHQQEQPQNEARPQPETPRVDRAARLRANSVSTKGHGPSSPPRWRDAFWRRCAARPQPSVMRLAEVSIYSRLAPAIPAKPAERFCSLRALLAFFCVEAGISPLGSASQAVTRLRRINSHGGER